MRDREGLIARIRQVRRAAELAGASATSGKSAPEQDGIRPLEARVRHLEQQLQGLQDSVHREALRQSRRLSELESQIKPEALSQALSRDARERGL